MVAALKLQSISSAKVDYFHESMGRKLLPYLWLNYTLMDNVQNASIFEEELLVKIAHLDSAFVPLSKPLH
jgi:hypothetical protein